MATPRSKRGGSELALTNQSLVYQVFGSGEKLTVSETHAKLAEVLTAQNRRPLNERTVRRSIEALFDMGQIAEFGTTPTNAILYGRVDVGVGANEVKVNLGGNLIDVKTFVQILTDHENRPFSLNPKAQLVSIETENKLRSILLYVVMSSGSTGQGEKLKSTLDVLSGAIKEAEHLLKVLRSFTDSPIWYEHYRDPVSKAVRDLQKDDPELFQLAIDVIKGG